MSEPLTRAEQIELMEGAEMRRQMLMNRLKGSPEFLRLLRNPPPPNAKLRQLMRERPLWEVPAVGHEGDDGFNSP